MFVIRSIPPATTTSSSLLSRSNGVVDRSETRSRQQCAFDLA